MKWNWDDMIDNIVRFSKLDSDWWWDCCHVIIQVLIQKNCKRKKTHGSYKSGRG
jgi:hypothetical protein